MKGTFGTGVRQLTNQAKHFPGTSVSSVADPLVMVLFGHMHVYESFSQRQLI